ncbi:MAG: DUF4469 domain-containing protein [Tannerella sp.]|jgi:hypothetical protein|nr:DUF4469 domain-containing protein [Tannerella sp.]
MDYFLINNHLTHDPNDQVAIPTNIRSYSDDQIIDRIMQRGTTLTRPDLLAGIRAYQEEHGYIVEEGNGFNTGLLNAGPNIIGKFDSATDSYDRSRHKMHYSVNFSRTIQDMIGKIKMNKVQAPNTCPVITAIKDSQSGLTDGMLSAGGVLDIAGSRLKVYPDLPDDGVYFIDAGGKEYKAVTLVENKPSRLIVMLPALPLQKLYAGGACALCEQFRSRQTDPQGAVRKTVEHVIATTCRWRRRYTVGKQGAGSQGRVRGEATSAAGVYRMLKHTVSKVSSLQAISAKIFF